MRVRRAIVLAGLAAVVAVPMAAAAPGPPAGVLVIDTFAGTGERGNSGDGGPATKAKLAGPTEIAIDGAGVVYVSQESGLGGDTIRKVDTKGVISKPVGTGDQVPTKEGIPADRAGLSRVEGLAADKSGNLYIVHLTRRNGVLITELYRLYQGEAGPMIRLIAGGGTVDLGKAKKGLEASLDGAYGVSTDSAGDVYVATPSRIVKVDHATNDLTLIAGNGETPTGAPAEDKDATQVPIMVLKGPVVDAAGNVYLNVAVQL